MPSELFYNFRIRFNCTFSNNDTRDLKKGQSAKVKAFTAHFPLKKERNINSYDVIAEQEKVLIFTGFVFAKSEPQMKNKTATDEHK